MIKTDKIFLNLYMFVAMAHIYCGAAGLADYEVVTKYLLMPMLGAHILANDGKRFFMVWTLFGAILFAWFGDIFLLYTNREESYFLFGLASFLISHIFYIISFRKLKRKGQSEKINMIYFIIPVIYSIGLIAWILNGLGDYTIPVIIYAAVITTMLIQAISRKGKTDYYSYVFVLTGAALFVVSDSMIAVSKFKTSIIVRSSLC